MNKQVFIIEVETNYGQKPALLSEIETGIREGFRECFRDEITLSSIYAASVEQNVEPLKNQEKMIDLLRRASDCLNSYRAELDGDYNDSLATEIDNFLKD